MVLEDSTCHRELSLCATTTEPTRPRAPAPQEKPPQRGAHALQPEEALTQQRRPSAAENKKQM